MAALRGRLDEALATHGLDAAGRADILDMVQAFSGYGFVRGHAAAHAYLAYVSAWIKVFYPAALCAALLNMQPMGFYDKDTLVQDARRHGVRVLPVDLRHSRASCALQQGAVRLGLRLVRGLGEMHGGTIEARSDGPGRGSEFIVRLPLLIPEAGASVGDQIPAADEKRDAPSPKRRRILVADDNVDLATSMGLLLEMMGNEVRVTHDGTAAVSADSEFQPDVIFLDIGMAKMNGFEACRLIRDNPRDSRPIIVALTGWGQADVRERTASVGADFRLVKPVTDAALEQVLGAARPVLPGAVYAGASGAGEA